MGSTTDTPPPTESLADLPPTPTAPPQPLTPEVPATVATATAELPATIVAQEIDESPTPVPTPAPESSISEALFYDNFEDISSGWPNELEVGNIYIGYHEPDFFHVDVGERNDRALASVPGQSFDDLTTEAEVLVDNIITAESGDFYYGLAVRRSGNQYYAFAISPRTNSWRIIKSSPLMLEILQEGSDDSIRGLEDLDVLRVDASGSTFTFHINGHPVGQITDPDYGSGEVALYVETLDSPKVHVHYDSLTIREAEAPQFVCTVRAFALNLRNGPGISFSPPITTLPAGTRFEPIARSSNALWLQIRLPESDQLGWVSSEERFVNCDFDVTDLAVP